MRLIGQILLAVALLELGSGLQGVLLPYRAEIVGFSTYTIGLLGTAYYVGFVAGCMAVPRIISRIGHIRVFSGFATLAAAGVLCHGLITSPWIWIVLRTGVGFSFAGMYLVIESWLNDRATDQTRGRVLASYLLVTWVGVIAGKLIFGISGLGSFDPFALAALATSLAVAPIAFTTMTQPPSPPAGRLHIGKLYQHSPVALVGCVLVGAANAAFWSLAPVFMASQAHSPFRVGLFIALAVAGGAVAQWPLGLASDRVDRRWVILLAALLAAGVGAILAFHSVTGDMELFGLAIAFGAGALPLYSLCVARANDKVTAQDFVEVSGGLLMAFGLGAIAGPLLASVAMTVWGPGGIFLFTAAVHLLLSLHTGVRVLAAPRPSEALKETFVAIPKSTQAAIILDPRTPPVETTEPKEAMP